VKEILDTLSAVLQRPIRYVGITDLQWAEAVETKSILTRSIICRIFGNTFDPLKDGAMKRLAALWIQSASPREAVRRLWKTSSGPTLEKSAAFRRQLESASSRVHPCLSGDSLPRWRGLMSLARMAEFFSLMGLNTNPFSIWISSGRAAISRSM
jgi:hypothetical protein